MSPTPLTLDEILNTPQREFIILGGKDGSGKSSAVVSLAAYVEMMSPDAKFFVIDTENKMRTVIKMWGDDVPKNIIYYHCPDMNACTEALEEILPIISPGDWIAVESMARVWEKAQDLGYNTVAGVDKATYLERRQAKIAEHGKKAAGSPIPRPDDFWNIVKGAHDSGFLERLSQHQVANVILTTTLQRPPKEGGFRKESEGRKDVRNEFGIDMGIDGAPRLPYHAETLCLLYRTNGQTYCRVVRDNLTTKEIAEQEIEIPSRKMWATAFMGSCRV